MITDLGLVSHKWRENLSEPIGEQADVFDERIGEVDLRKKHRFDTCIVVNMLEREDAQQIPERIPCASIYSGRVLKALQDGSDYFLAALPSEEFCCIL
ncbi:hypothetical protein PVW53_19575 [Seohaeicola sp. SP36]|uniref:hypothetical protein n=1 Tax=unclassified Seohaeicola TaxID=2641111 RepID=UPI00237B80A5|nr:MULTISPECIES: hypothetical protein [unclassified Seohaeicola]MDD9709490.1 hypothetical protein [Seohaeicola sp. 4SK31]MDD9737713.1 hypothetical protein [Seohaeicola sp. SP36]